MKDLIPTEDEFELLIGALNSYEKDQVAAWVVEQYLKKMKNLTNEKAFVDAFSNKPDEISQNELLAKTKEVRDRVVVVAAKLIQLRNHVRESRLAGDIENLLK